MGEVVTTGYIKDGRLEMRNRKQVHAQLKRMKDGEVLITIARTRAARSVLQNRYYWGVVIELLSEHTGHTPDELHELMKARFIPKNIALRDGSGEIVGEFVIGGSTAKMNKLEFGEYMESIRRWAAEDLDCVIPDPDTGALWPGAKSQRKGKAA